MGYPLIATSEKKIEYIKGSEAHFYLCGEQWVITEKNLHSKNRGKIVQSEPHGHNIQNKPKNIAQSENGKTIPARSKNC